MIRNPHKNFCANMPEFRNKFATFKVAMAFVYIIPINAIFDTRHPFMAIAISILPSHILSKILQNNICTGENIHHIPPFMPSLYITELKYDFGRLSKKFSKIHTI